MNFSKKQILQFLLLTFGITWGCWGGIALLNQFGLLAYGQPVTMIIFLLGGNSLPIASYILYKRWRMIRSFKDFLKLNFNPRLPMKGYLFTFLLLLMNFLLISLLLKTDQQFPLYYGLLMFPINLLGGGLEEIGWRGILQPFMEKAYGFILGTFIVSLIWTAWHIPLWFIAGTYQATISFIYFFFLVIGFSYMLAALRRSYHSIFLCILLHAFINSFMGVLYPTFSPAIILLMGIEVIVSLLVVLRQNRKIWVRG